MTIFGIILRNHGSKYRLHQHATNCTIFKNFLGGSVKSCNVCTFIAFLLKNYDTKRSTFHNF